MLNLRIVLIYMGLHFLVLSLPAQVSYLATYFPNSGNPGGVNTTNDNVSTGWTSILPGNLNTNVWSPTQSLPFAFSYFGTPVNQFKVSANGLITFDVTSALLPGPNGFLPNAGLPNNTIACFWDDFTNKAPTGSNDEVFTEVFGPTGSRQLWIKWFSFEYGNPSGNTFNYFACVLEEGTNKVYMVDMSNSGNVANMSTTVGIQQSASKAVQYGNTNITFGSAGSSNISNNGFYEFEPFTQIPTDVAILSLESPMGDGCYTSNTPVTINILNLGSQAATGMTARYASDGQTFSAPEPIPGTIASGDTLLYTFASPVDLSSVTSYEMAIAIDLAGDGDDSNDSIYSTINSLGIIPAPFTEDFDAGIPAFWLNDPNDDGEDWRNSITGDANNGPGPTDHTSGSGEYMWVDDSSPHSNASNFITPCIDLAGMNFPQLEFWLWSFNLNSVSQDMILHVDIESGSIWNNDVLPAFGSQTANWIPIQLSLAAYAGETIRLRFRMEENGGGFEHDVAIDDLSITEGLSNDVGFLQLIEPAIENCGLSSSESITIEIRNFGGMAISGVTASYAVDGNPPIPTETIPGTLQPGDTAVYTFSASADFSLLGPHSVEVFLNLSGDVNPINDSLMVMVPTFGLVSGPYSENFDTGFPLDWINDPNDAGEEWLSSTDGSAGFGPDSIDHTSGTGEFLWVDDSGPHSVASNLISPCIDITTMVDPELVFWVWSHNEDSTEDDTKLHVDIYANGVWNNDIIPAIADMDSMWEEVVVDLDTFLGTVINVRFRMEEFDTGFKHDIAIDDFEIKEGTSIDVGIVGLARPAGDGCGLTATDTISVFIRNLGGNEVSGITATFSIDGNPFVPAEPIPDTLQAGDTAVYTFMATADFSALGAHSFEAYVIFADDEDSSNDSLITTITHIAGFSAPYTENFDNGFPTDWNNDPSDAGEDWLSSSASSAGFGPDTVDHTSGTGEYVWVDDSGPHSAETNLISPCIDMSTLAAPQLEFWVWSNNVDTATADALLHVDIYANGLWILDVIAPISDMDAGWEYVLIDLAAFIGTNIQVRFRAKEFDTGFKHDIAIDDFRIFEVLTDDIQVSKILGPKGVACEFGTSEPVTIEIENQGINPMSGITASYQLDGMSSAVETVPGTLLPGEKISYTFATGINLSNSGQYSLTTVATSALDENEFNDSLQADILNLLPTTVALQGVFENYPVGSTEFNDLYNDQTAQVPWQVQSGPTATVATGPANDVSVGGSYIYLESSGSDEGDVGIIYSECVDLSALNFPSLSFYSHMYGSSVGSLSVDIISNGITTNELLLTGEQQNASTSPWISHDIDLSAYGNATIQVCFRGEILADSSGQTFNGDIALDDVKINQVFAVDIAPVEISLSPVPCMFSDAEPIAVEVSNVGINTLTNIILSYSINGGAFSSPEILSGPIVGGDTSLYTFMTTADLSALGNYDIKIAVIVSGDENTSNDTILTSIANDVESPTTDFTYTNNANTITFSNTTTGGGNLTYVWDFGDASSINTDVNPVHTYPSSGSYLVSLTASNQCGNVPLQETIFVQGADGVDDVFAAQIQVFPNPSSGDFEIRFDQAQLRRVELAIYAIQGQQVYHRSYEAVGGPGVIPVRFAAGIPDGIYLLTLKSKEGMMHQRVMLRR